MTLSEDGKSSPQKTNRVKNLEKLVLTDDERRQIKIRALEAVEADKLRTKLEQKRLKREDRLRRETVGVYEERRSILMLIVEYAFLLVMVALTVFMIIWLDMQAPEILSDVVDEFLPNVIVAGVAYMLVLIWIAVRIYYLWAGDWIYADIDKVSRRREGVWFLGIKGVGIKVDTIKSSYRYEQSVLEKALVSFRIPIRSHTGTIDTAAQEDRVLLSNLKYIKDGHRLAAIINSK